MGGKGDGGLFPILATSALYGAFRPQIAGIVSPVSGMIPSGYGDEIVLGTIGYFVAKKVSNPWIKTLGKSMLIVEAASIGAQFAAGTGTPSTSSMQTIG